MGGYSSKFCPILWSRKYNLNVSKVEIVKYQFSDNDYEELLVYNEEIR